MLTLLLQQMKLDLLKSRRNADVALTEDKTHATYGQLEDTTKGISSPIYPHHAPTSIQGGSLDSMNSFLLERLRIRVIILLVCFSTAHWPLSLFCFQTNFAMSAYHLMTTKPISMLSRHVDSRFCICKVDTAVISLVDRIPHQSDGSYSRHRRRR